MMANRKFQQVRQLAIGSHMTRRGSKAGGPLLTRRNQFMLVGCRCMPRNAGSCQGAVSLFTNVVDHGSITDRTGAPAPISAGQRRLSVAGICCATDAVTDDAGRGGDARRYRSPECRISKNVLGAAVDNACSSFGLGSPGASGTPIRGDGSNSGNMPGRARRGAGGLEYYSSARPRLRVMGRLASSRAGRCPLPLHRMWRSRNRHCRSIIPRLGRESSRRDARVGFPVPRPARSADWTRGATGWG
jgi:hypothetical protein